MCSHQTHPLALNKQYSGLVEFLGFNSHYSTLTSFRLEHVFEAEWPVFWTTANGSLEWRI